MINPNALLRAKGTVINKDYVLVQSDTRRHRTVKVLVGLRVDMSKFKPGQSVNVQMSYSITLDEYVIQTVRPNNLKVFRPIVISNYQLPALKSESKAELKLVGGL